MKVNCLLVAILFIGGSLALFNKEPRSPWEEFKTVNANPVQNYRGHVLKRYGNKLVEFGGIWENRTESGLGQMKKIYSHLRILDLNTRSWSDLNYITPKPSNRAWPAGAVLNGQYYIFGGCGDFYAPLSDLWRFNFSSSKWTQLQSNNTVGPSPRSGASMAVYGRYLVVTGGVNGYTYESYNDIWFYDTVTGLWSKKVTHGDIPSTRAYPKINIKNNKMTFAFGEYIDPTPITRYENDIYSLNLNNFEWTLLENNAFARARLHSGVVFYENEIHVHSGDYGSCDLDLLVPGTYLCTIDRNTKCFNTFVSYANMDPIKGLEMELVDELAYGTGGYTGIECDNSQMYYHNKVYTYKPNNAFDF